MHATYRLSAKRNYAIHGYQWFCVCFDATDSEIENTIQVGNVRGYDDENEMRSEQKWQKVNTETGKYWPRQYRPVGWDD